MDNKVVDGRKEHCTRHSGVKFEAHEARTGRERKVELIEQHVMSIEQS